MRRLVVLISVVVLVDTMFYAVVAPLLPHYADELGLSKAAAGILTAAFPAGTLLGSLPSGVLVGRIGARPTLYIGLTLMAASSLAFGFAEHVVLLDAARFVQGIAAACTWSGGLAWLIEAAPPERRGELIGTTMGAAIGGALFGPVVGAVAEATAPQIVFGSVVVIAAALALWASRTPAPATADRQGLEAVGRAVRERPVLVAMWLVALPAVGFGVIGVLGPLRLDDLGFGAAAIGGTYLVAAGIEAAISPVVGRVSDRRGRLVPIRFGLAAAVVLLCLFTLPRTAALLAALIVATTASLGTFWAPAMTMLSDASEAAGLHQGLAFALMNLAWAMGQVTGSAGGGALAKVTGDAVAVALVAGLGLATLVALARVRDRRALPL